MSDMKITLPDTATITITGQVIDRLIRAGDGDAALLYLYILKMNGELSSSQAAIALDKSKGWIASALATLSRIGLASVDEQAAVSGEEQKPPLKQPRNYSVEEIKTELASGSDFSHVIEETQRVIGRILSPDELLRLFGIYDYLRLPADVIMLLMTHCISESRRTGGGRAPSVRYIEKAAYTWEREGLFTAEKAEEYLKKLDERRNVRSRIKDEMRIRDREFSATEARYVDSWIQMGFEPEAVAIAYDKTVVKTGRMAWPYMDSILKNWYKKDLLTEAKVLESEGKTPPGDLRIKSTEKHGKPNQEELDRMAKILKKITDE
ncbi:MAG: DnaD domain protein [Oscillospiraceae bacterium]|nr:DnaD domain protein [Oscillospiraceae bacterium]